MGELFSQPNIINTIQNESNKKQTMYGFLHLFLKVSKIVKMLGNHHKCHIGTRYVRLSPVNDIL